MARAGAGAGSAPGRASLLLRPAVWLCVVAHLSAACVSGLTLKLDRATARTLLIDIMCGSSCDGAFTWEYKSSEEAAWGKPPRMRPHYLNPFAHYVTLLPQSALHYLRVKRDPAGEYSNVLATRTCAERPPAVSALRLADGGPGWLDIRWTRPKESCLARYYYHVRYRAGDGPFTARKTFGYYNMDGSRASVNPSHPCDTNSTTFCVLLTDHVRAGETHTVEVQAERIGGTESEITAVQYLSAFADPTNTGLHCSFQKGQQEGHNTTESEKIDDFASGVALPLWVAALLGTTFFLLLAVIVAMWLAYRFQNASEAKEQEHRNLPRCGDAPAVERYVRPGCLPAVGSSNVYESYTNDVPLYEEIGVNFRNQQSLNSPTVQYKTEKHAL